VSSGILKSDTAKTILETPGVELQVATVMDGEELSHPESVVVPEGAVVSSKRDIDVSSKEYGRAGDWVGVLFAIQAIGSILWAMVLPLFRQRRKLAYSLSLVIGAIGFILTFFCKDTTQTNVVIMNIPATVAQLQLCGCYLLIGCAWAAMLAIPFTIVTNSIKEHMGSYLGLFNCSICLPQIMAAAVGGLILGCFPEVDGVAQQPYMLVVAGVLLLLGAASVFLIKEGKK
jgi:maltose/moltooligosaccharide transporter